MSEVDKDLSGRYHAASREEPPEHLDAAILAASKRAVSSQPLATWSPRAMRRWYVPVSLAAVIVLSVVVTLQVGRERPEIAMPDAVPVERKERDLAAQPPPAPAPAPAEAPAPEANPLSERARMNKSPADAPRPGEHERKPAAADQAAASPAPVFVPEPGPSPKPAAKLLQSEPVRELMREEKPREDSQRPADAARSASASGELASSAGRQARAMSAPAASAPAPAADKATLAKRELAPDEWLERIADLRRQQRDREADEQFAEFRRRYPDYKIPEAMNERIAPRK